MTYEEISANPVAVAKDVYAFAELPWNAQIEQGIFNSTTAKGIPVTDAWKSTMSEHSIDIVTESCNHMLEYLGYLDPVTPSVQPAEVGVGDEMGTDGQAQQVLGGQVQGEYTPGAQIQSGQLQDENTVESYEASTTDDTVEGTVGDINSALEYNDVESYDVGSG